MNNIYIYLMNNNIPNGGFPPIKFCKKEKILKDTEFKYFANSKKVNIQEIIKSKKNKEKFINTEEETEQLEDIS